MSQKIVIVDYKTSNLDSIFRATQKFESNCTVTNDSKVIAKADKLILPGQGSFFFGMKQINELGIRDVLIEKIKIEKKPTLGICLGMHLLADYGYEIQKTKGLSLIKGEVKKMRVNLKLPHIGWNEVSIKKDLDLFKNIQNNKDFYFVHSYEFCCENSKDIAGLSKYENNFNSVINFENIFGVQFHPEKSLKTGLELINNFTKI